MLGAYTTFVVQNGFKQLGTWFEIYIFCLSFSFPDNRCCGISSGAGGNSVSLWATAGDVAVGRKFDFAAVCA